MVVEGGHQGAKFRNEIHSHPFTLGFRNPLPEFRQGGGGEAVDGQSLGLSIHPTGQAIGEWVHDICGPHQGRTAQRAWPPALAEGTAHLGRVYAN